jgi:hypothetical protein
MRWSTGVVAVLITAVVVLSVLGATARADDKVPLGGGAGIVVNGAPCTLATIGHDKTGELVGFTAASCGGPGSSVDIEGGPGGVGNVVAANDDLDYAVIKFDPAKVVPTASFAGFAINGIGPDLGGDEQPPCTRGGATGYGCGSMKVRLKPAIAMARVPTWQPGDDGAPVTVDGQLIGMTRKGHTMAPLMVTDITLTLFSSILADVNANGGPGAGFSPIPA